MAVAEPAGAFRVTSQPHDGTDKPQTVVFLRPLAAPSAAGLSGYAASTFIVATWLASWYGGPQSPGFIWPFVLMYGGVGQFLAGVWSVAARDVLASVVHLMWGSFWVALGVLFALMSTSTIPTKGPYEVNPALGIWMCTLAFITLMCAAASLVRDMVLSVTLFLLGVGSIFGAIGWFTGSRAVIEVAAYFWIVSVFTALWRVAGYFVSEALPERAKPGQNPLLPVVFSPRGLKAMHSRGYKDGFSEPGVLHGN